MHLSIVLLATVPALALTVLMVWAIVSMIRSALNRQGLTWLQVTMVVLWLMALDLGVTMFMTVSAGLSHSAAAVHRLPVLCVLSFSLLVAIPAISLLLFRRWLNRRNRKERET